MLQSISDRVLFVIVTIISLASYGSILTSNLFQIVALGGSWGFCSPYAYDWECSNAYLGSVTQWLRDGIGLIAFTDLSISGLLYFLIIWIIFFGFIQATSILLPFLFARKIKNWILRSK